MLRFRGARRVEFRRQVMLMVALQALAGIVLGGPLLMTGRLINDRLADFYFFRDTLHSLNAFGEFPWWNPSIWAGFPFYYINFLYWPGRGPLFTAVSLVCWLLGRIPVAIGSYFNLYVVYFAFLVPLVMSLGVLALARQILRRPLAVYLVIVVMAFSPGVMLSLSDHGSAVSAYGFWFVAALIRFLRKPTRSRFLLLTLTAMAVATTFTYYALMWNVFFVPLMIVVLCVGRGGVTRRAAHSFGQISGRWWAGAVVGVVLCVLPTFLTYRDGSEIRSTRADGERYYTYAALRSGTPLEALAISTPGVGFEWSSYEDANAVFQPRLISQTSSFSSFGYMGLVTLPLVCLGLVLGRPYWTLRLFGCIALAVTTLILSGHGPVLSLVLGLPSPLRGNNHLSDLVVRVGLFALYALAAGLGFEALERSTPARRWTLAGMCGLTSVISLAWVLSLGGAAAAEHYVFGLTVALIVFYGIGLVRLALARTPAQIRNALIVLLALLFIDTSTFAFAHLRLSYARASGSPIEPGPDAIGSVVGREETGFLYLLDLDDPDLLVQPARAATLKDRDSGELLPAQTVVVERRTYNGVALLVTASQEAILESRGSYFPFWRAWVNGREVPVERSARGMKSVRIPAGQSTVVFRFSPTALRVAVAGGPLSMSIVLTLWLFARRAERNTRIAR